MLLVIASISCHRHRHPWTAVELLLMVEHGAAWGHLLMLLLLLKHLHVHRWVIRRVVVGGGGSPDWTHLRWGKWGREILVE